MSSEQLVSVGRGLASAAAGLLLLLGHLLDIGGDPQYGTALGGGPVLSAYLALVFGLVALWSTQAERSGISGSVGMVLGVVGAARVWPVSEPLHAALTVPLHVSADCVRGHVDSPLAACLRYIRVAF